MSMFLMDWVDAPAAPSSARAADTSKFYWYAPDSVVESGGVITSWDDKGPNSYDLAQVDSLSKPTYAASAVSFAGSQVLGLSGHAYANSLKSVLNTGGSIAVFIVARCDIAGQAVSTNVNYVMLSEGSGTATFNNNIMAFWANGRTFNTPRTVRMGGYNRSNSSNAFDLGTVGENSARNNALMLWRYVITQTDADFRVHPITATGTIAVTAASFAAAGNGLFIGGMVSGGTTLGSSFIGAVHEVYATTDVSTGNVDAITTELETVYGL